MCLLPPNCLFCRHFNRGSHGNEADCAAFTEIPEVIFRGLADHTEPFPGDGGVRFDLDPSLAEDFAELVTVREAMLQRGIPSHG
jgi:hypothetical protein